MNGDRYLLDTNAIVAVLKGNSRLIILLQNADWIGISVISQIEFLSFSGLSQADSQLFEQFIQRVEVIDLVSTDPVLLGKIIEIRQQFRLKLPDAIIAAMASQNSASLVTANREFAKVNSLKIINNWQ